MPVNHSGLSIFNDQTRKEFWTKLIAGSVTFDSSNVETITGIKAGTKVTRRFIDHTPYYQTGSNASCPGLSGSTVFAERELTTTAVAIEDGWCRDELVSKLPFQFGPGANGDFNVPDEFLDLLAATINNDLNVAFWQGGRINTNNLNTNVTGWLKRLINDTFSGDTWKPSGTYTSVTTSNAIAMIDDLLLNIPTALQTKDFIIDADYDLFKSIQVAYRNAYGAGSIEFLPDMPNSFKASGYGNITFRLNAGLAGSKKAVATPVERGDLLATVDVSNDPNNIDVWYSKDDDKFRYRVKFAAGTHIKFATEIGVLSYGA
jgi:hypothetical protein